MEPVKRPAEILTGFAGTLLLLSEAFWTDFSEPQLLALGAVIAGLPSAITAIVETWRSFRVEVEYTPMDRVK